MKNASNGEIGTRVFQRSIVVDIWHGLHSGKPTGWHPVTCFVSLEIDVDSLMRQLARKALGNGSKKTHLAGGRIRLKTTAIEKPADDGVNGQDRESYSDTQDRNSYSTE